MTAIVKKPRMQQQQEIRATTRQLRRFETLQDMKEADSRRCLNLNLYDVLNKTLPLTQTEFDTDFPAIKAVFSDEPDLGDRCTNLSFGASVDCPTVLTGIGVLAVGEGYGFGVPGIMVPTPAAPGDPTPCNDGCPDAGQAAAVFEWGQPTWEFLEGFFSSTRVEAYLCRSFKFVDEWARDMGLTIGTNQFGGAGHAVRGVMNQVRATNDALLAKGCDYQFLPQNAVNTDNTYECFGAPTAETIWGHPCIPSVAGKLFRLPFPILLIPGVPLNFRFVRTCDDCAVDAMKRAAVLDCAAGAVKPSASFDSALACTAAGDAAVWTVPGGCFQLGMVLATYEVSSCFCLQYYNEVISSGNKMLGEMLLGNPNVVSYIGGLRNEPRQLSGLGGLSDEQISEMMNNVSRYIGMK